MKTYIIAEMSANHNQDYGLAEELVCAAKEAGADAIKLQTYTPETMTIDCSRPEFTISNGTPWDNQTLFELYKRACMPWEWQPKLKKLADEIGIELFSSVYDKTSVDFLEKMGVARYKIASFELVDIPLIEYVSSKGKPILLSTGMASQKEIIEAVFAAKESGATDITLLKCVSEYPAPVEKINMFSMPSMGFNINGLKISLGFSDHTLSTIIPVVAVSLGAEVVEKHLTISRKVPSPDSSFSLEPQEFKEMVDNIRIADKTLNGKEVDSGNKMFRRSLFVVKDMKKGDLFSDDNLRSIRPSYGLSPKYLPFILGRKALNDIDRGTPLKWDYVR